MNSKDDVWLDAEVVGGEDFEMFDGWHARTRDLRWGHQAEKGQAQMPQAIKLNVAKRNPKSSEGTIQLLLSYLTRRVGKRTLYSFGLRTFNRRSR